MKKLNLPSLAVALLWMGFSAQAQNVLTAEYPILSGADDVEQDLTSGEMYLTSSDIELTRDGSSEQLVALRFDNVTIPPGSIILSAYIQVTVDEVNTSGDVNVAIGIEDSPNAEPYSSAPFDIAERSYFAADTTVWNVPAFENENEAGPAQQTPDLTDLVAHVIALDGWESGNALAFSMIDPFQVALPGYAGNGSNKRVFQTFDNGADVAAKLVVNFELPNSYFNGTFPIAAGSTWLYNDQGQDLSGTNWNTLAYEGDSAWAFGPAQLGYGDGDEATTISFGPDENNKHITTYLRHIFDASEVDQIDSLIFNVLRDDGAIVYVNGVEAFRMNMPEGPVGASALAQAAVSGGEESTYFTVRTGNLLQEGENVIAVELHQSSASSSDLGFDMEVDFIAVPLQAAAYPFSAGSEWSYLDSGISLDSTSWTTADYNDYEWAYGPAPLGYGEELATIVSFGPDADNKFITTYFRRAIDINTAELPDSVVFRIRRDDGAVVYLNGEELFRQNMPEGEINYLTTSSEIISGDDENTFFNHIVSSEVFENGLNQIAVEIHNRDGQSSDLIFDFALQNLPAVNPPADCSTPHIACFTSIDPTAQTELFIYPQEHRFQQLHREGSTYSIGGGIVPGNHDFTGYVPINGSSELGHLSVNHENTPGGVSMLDLHYDAATKLWVVDSSQAVDMYTESLVTTTRNCSGGITPWNTVITAEESLNSGDLNADGYQDVGWLVEIDPETASVMDYDGDGNEDKLWAMGRMSHENVAVTADGTTAYYGEDGGTQCVYKYVADVPGDLTSGTLYVLSLDQPLTDLGDPTGSTAQWIQVPNTTQEDRNNTNSLAAALGGTNFNGVEDCEISPVDGMIYFTSKGNDRVYRFSEAGDGVTSFETFVGGTAYSVSTASGEVSEEWGGGNDNLTFDDQGNLWVLQDGGLNYIWVVRPDHSQINPNVELFASVPNGAEPTGLTFSPDFRFGFFSIQHPSGSNALTQVDASGEAVDWSKDAVAVIALASELGTEQNSIACEGTYSYFLSDVQVAPQDTTSTIYGVSLDQTSGTATLEALTTLNYEAHIAYSNQEQALYVVRSQGGAYRTLDVSQAGGALGAEITPSVSLPKVTTAAVDSSGQLILGDHDLNFVYAVNPADGVASFLGTATVSGGDLTIGAEGQLFLASREFGGTLYSIDPATWQITEVGAVPATVTGAALTAEGSLLISAKDSSALTLLSPSGSSTVASYALSLQGAPFTSLDGDLAAGCVNATTGTVLEQSQFAQELTSSQSNTYIAEAGVSPNPSEGQVQFYFTALQQGQVTVEVYDLSGRRIAEVFHSSVGAGQAFRLDFDASALPNGIYLYRIANQGHTITDRFAIAR